jgi:serine/threonine-protein kinase
MAEVLEAVAVSSEGFERRVAIKRMLPELVGSEDFTRMFIDEANIASRLHHPNVASVIDFGIADGLPFQVIELVDGLDLHTLGKRAVGEERLMPPAAALHLAGELAYALEYVHRLKDDDGQPLGVVHRDVSPGNVLIAWTGNVKLADFGIAFSKARTAEQTAIGTTKGTPGYMSPEQALASGIDSRTDIFALGCVLYFACTGKTPLSEANRIRALRGEALLFGDGLPEEVLGIVERATRGLRDERYPTAGDFARAAAAAAARMLGGHRDPKSVWLSWLAGFDPRRATDDERPKYDAFLSPTGGSWDGARDSSRVESATERQPATPVAAPRIGPDAPNESETTTRSPALRVAHPKAGLRAVLVAVASGGVALAVLFSKPWREGPRVQSGPAVASSTGSIPEASPVAAASPAEQAAAPVQPDAAAFPRTTLATPEKKLPPESSALKTPAATASGKQGGSAPQAGVGVFVVGGAGALRGEIFVDGERMGFAPRELALPLGTHTVTVIAADGGVLGTNVVNLTARHTVSSPLVWKIVAPG